MRLPALPSRRPTLVSAVVDSKPPRMPIRSQMPFRVNAHSRHLPAAVLLLALAACSPQVPVAAYQQATERQCHYRPSERTVRDLLATKNEVLADPDTMARAICRAVTNLGDERNRQ